MYHVGEHVCVVLYTYIDQTLMNSLHGLLNYKIKYESPLYIGSLTTVWNIINTCDTYRGGVTQWVARLTSIVEVVN